MNWPSLYGRNSAAGTYGYFKEHALFKGAVKEQPGSASVVLAVTEDKAGLRYSGIGYKTSGVKTLAHSKLNGEPAYEPNHDNVLAGKYPHGRMLYLYVAKQPEPAEEEPRLPGADGCPSGPPGTETR